MGTAGAWRVWRRVERECEGSDISDGFLAGNLEFEMAVGAVCRRNSSVGGALKISKARILLETDDKLMVTSHLARNQQNYSG